MESRTSRARRQPAGAARAARAARAVRPSDVEPSADVDAAFEALTRVLNARFREQVARVRALARRADPRAGAVEVPEHRIVFSKRITTSWALIYFRRHEVRLSPYLFLLEPGQLKHASYWRELDATLAHEAAHAYLWARDRLRDHTPEFHALYEGLGYRSNGELDLGPTNLAYRYVYHCSHCGREWLRRAPLRGNWSCGTCSPGRFTPERRMILRERLPPPWARLAPRLGLVHDATREGRASLVGGSE